jgi:hypothetical protein
MAAIVTGFGLKMDTIPINGDTGAHPQLLYLTNGLNEFNQTLTNRLARILPFLISFVVE